MNVAENLYDYLKHNNKAEISGLGTFYVKEYSAVINDLSFTIEPPKRQLFFTKEQTDDRGFVSFMAQNEFISEDTAYTWIKQYADSLTEKIEAGRKVSIGKLGKLEKGLLEEYNFTASEELNLLDDSFALGVLKNVKTFDANDNDLTALQKKNVNTSLQAEQVQQPQNVMPEEFAKRKQEIEQQIEQAKQIRQEARSNEDSQSQTARVIQHSEAVIDTDVTKPVADTDSRQEKLNADNVTDEDKTLQTEKRASEFKENVIVEDIKPAKEKEEKTKVAVKKEENKEDALIKQAEDIVNKYGHGTVAKGKRKHVNKRKRSWLTVLWILIVLLLLAIAFLGLHRFGFLKDIQILKPVTEKLAYYIPVKERQKIEEPKQEETATVQTPTEETYTVAEEEDFMQEDTYIQNEPTQTAPASPAPASKKPLTKKVTLQNQTQNSEPAPVVQVKIPEVEDNSPVVVQNHSKLGFDVIGGTFSDRSKAEAAARKAKRLGYDGYILSKLKNGVPVYYVSYGSRRTLNDANDLMQTMINRLGGNYYVMSR